MLAAPRAARTSTSSLTANEKAMFCRTIRPVRRARRRASGSLPGSSFISTTSAASMAASEPKAPMATPTSARESTGASFTPSPV